MWFLPWGGGRTRRAGALVRGPIFALIRRPIRHHARSMIAVRHGWPDPVWSPGVTRRSGTMLLEWINHADLMQVSGVGAEYADLLEDAGVDTVAELVRRNAANLMATMRYFNAEKEAL